MGIKLALKSFKTTVSLCFTISQHPSKTLYQPHKQKIGATSPILASQIYFPCTLPWCNHKFSYSLLLTLCCASGPIGYILLQFALRLPLNSAFQVDGRSWPISLENPWDSGS